MYIEVKNLNKKFESFALKDVSIKVPKGKIVGLIGENGAGKTTLIKCILNAMYKDSGEIKLFNKEYDEDLKNKIGVVYDDSFVNQSFKVKDINDDRVILSRKSVGKEALNWINNDLQAGDVVNGIVKNIISSNLLENSIRSLIPRIDFVRNDKLHV